MMSIVLSYDSVLKYFYCIFSFSGKKNVFTLLNHHQFVPLGYVCIEVTI